MANWAWYGNNTSWSIDEIGNQHQSIIMFVPSLLRKVRSLLICRRSSMCFNHKLVHLDVRFHLFDKRLHIFVLATRKQTINQLNLPTWQDRIDRNCRSQKKKKKKWQFVFPMPLTLMLIVGMPCRSVGKQLWRFHRFPMSLSGKLHLNNI